jgi:4-amino-4-deoxy-L-arabinose transferase-like glycosyltransferase
LKLLKLIEPRRDAPLPLWMIFPVVFAALYATHFTLLRLPYYWDEAGYYIPAAWDFFRTGSLIPQTTLTNAHPPLPSIYLALWWKLSGFYPEVTREAVLMVASLGLLAVWRLAMRLVGVGAVAFWTVVLTGLYPIWFAQSSLAHADIFAAACTLWGLVYALPERGRKPWAAAAWFAAAALCKETAIAVPLTLALVDGLEAWRAKADGGAGSHSSRKDKDAARVGHPDISGSHPGDKDKSVARVGHLLWREAALFAGCVVPLCCWYAWHYAKTGFLFGNPEYLRYNAQANLDALRIAAALAHRVLQLTAHMNLFVPVGTMLSAWLLLQPRTDAEGHERAQIGKSATRRILALLAVNAVLFSVLGGALLTRYLLPMYPLVLLGAVTTFYRRVPLWQGMAVLSAAAFVAGLFVNPPYGFAPEDNLAYAHVVRLHLAGIGQLKKQFPGSTVLTAWPMSDELTKPELGYLKEPFAVYRLEDFSEAQIARAAQEPQEYSTALVFSTKAEPKSPLPWLASGWLEERYFGLHHDLAPEVIARQLGGTLVWKKEDQGEWVGLIRFNRAIDAKVDGGWFRERDVHSIFAGE